jgi:diguanylate cyclase (GGDEF)-like protein
MVNADDILNARILIVDDQQANVMLMEHMLHEAGYRCISSTMNPHAVCALHRDNRYDLILLDLQMPGMDGFQVMEGLKEIETDGYLPVLVMTAQPGHKLRALNAGAKDFISKPFDLMEARTRIHNMLEVRLLYKQLEQYSRALETMALYDALTGLPNRRLLFDRLALAIAHARRHTSTMAVIYLDLDGFKQINDTLGHDAGDTLLRVVADRLVAAVRQEDTVARMGGDEFVITLWELNHADNMAMLVSKIILAVSQPYSIHGHDVNITASVGVGIYPTHGEEVETLMKSADLALYDAKRTGKNAWRIATCAAPPAMDNSCLNRPRKTGAQCK